MIKLEDNLVREIQKDRINEEGPKNVPSPINEKSYSPPDYFTLQKVVTYGCEAKSE